MNATQWTCLYLLALAASAPAQAASSTPEHDAGTTVMLDDSIDFNGQLLWQPAELPYVRLLAHEATPRAHWSLAAYPAHGAPPALARPASIQAVPVAAEVPEASMVSMLLVGLGLLALGAHGERQEKFQQRPRPHL